MKRYYCTYFDINYLVKGLALIESLNRHEKNDFQIFVICLDEITRIILNKLNLQNIKTIPFHEIEQRDFPLLEAKQNRSLVEYYWTITPTIILRIFERHPEIDLLTYLDADLYFYSSPDPIFDELDNHSILIHEHRFSQSQSFLEKFGKYNVGLLCFCNDASGLEALTWWRDRCIEWCYARLENGKYGDQLYLNDWPERFKQVVVLQNIGTGVGPWNHIQYDFSIDPDDNKVLVNKLPLVFYHFHSLTFVEPGIIIPSKYVTNPLSKDILCLCFLPYIKTLSQTIETVRALLPDFTFGIVNKDALNYKHTFLAKQNMDSSLKRLAVSQSKISLDEEWNCYCSAQLIEFSNHITNIYNLIEANKIEEAFSTLSCSSKEFPDSPDLLIIQAELENQAVSREKALETLSGIVERWPEYYMALNDIGAIFWEAGDKKRAIEHMKRAFSINPYDRDVVFNAINMMINIEEYDNAEAVLLNYLKVFKDDAEVSGLLKNVRDLKGIGRVR